MRACEVANGASRALGGFALLEVAGHAVSARIACIDQIDRIHARAGRPLARPTDQLFHRDRPAGRKCLHAAVAAVAHPAAHAESLCCLHHRPAVAHALHAAADDEVAGDGGVVVHCGADQYDLGSPSAFSAMKFRIICGLTGAMRGM
ncbi:hypothetical protein VAPA_1c48650 [Variovorax paradoxus B4]|uniref:Uncharacterized protein n=1 Tax=Variovorax paradoxus B4 TaxID=1246301 RepID=T1XIG8_VARPD|nr:hypothetical protein VAPA_1c48650 [Variovorax paradoxus B4]